MKLIILILTLTLATSVSAQTERKSRNRIDVFRDADSIFNAIISKGYDTVLIYYLRRNPSQTIISKDNSSDHFCAYIFWQSKDSSFIKKINTNYIYKTKYEIRRLESSDLSISCIFDYYKSKKIIIDTQEFRPTKEDLLDKNSFQLFGKDTSYGLKSYGCTDCLNSNIKFKIGNATKEKYWNSRYLNRDNDFFNENLNSELYHLILILNEVMVHYDRQQCWTKEGTKKNGL